jgi:hypothetical protein
MIRKYLHPSFFAKENQMLQEGERLIGPVQVKNQVEWEKLEGVVVLGLGKKGEQNVLHMSTVTIEELALLSKQLDSHLVCLMGPMKEG